MSVVLRTREAENRLIAMTLVVARIQKGRVAVVSDTLLTRHGKALPLQEGVIKTCMLPGNLCVSFSNSPELATADFRRFKDAYPSGAGFVQAVDFFEAASAKSGNDYLLAFCPIAKLVKIADGKRIRSLANTAWIGDKSAYERFREYESRKRSFPQHGRAVNAVLFMDEIEGTCASDLFSAMRNVILDRGIPSVGGFAYTVSSRDNGYRQSVYCDALHDWPIGADQDYQLDYNDPIDFGSSGENFDFTVAQISAGYMGVNLVAFYLLKARKLFAFYSDDAGLPDQCRVVSDVSPSDIKHVLTALFVGINDWLVTIVGSAPGRSHSTRGTREPGRPGGMRTAFFVHENSLADRK
jgi:hypothetical protein